MSAAFLCRFTRDVVIASGGSEVVDVPIDGARDWTVLLDVSGVGDLDTCTYRRSPLGDLFGPTVSPTGFPVATGGQAEIIETGGPLTTVRFTLGSTAGCTVKVRAGGW